VVISINVSMSILQQTSGKVFLPDDDTGDFKVLTTSEKVGITLLARVSVAVFMLPSPSASKQPTSFYCRAVC